LAIAGIPIGMANIRSSRPDSGRWDRSDDGIVAQRRFLSTIKSFGDGCVSRRMANTLTS